MSEIRVLVLVALPLLAMLLFALFEVATRRDLTVGRRMIWFVALVFAPIVGLAVYIVVRPPRAVTPSGGEADTSAAEAVVLVAERRQRGELDDDRYRTEIAAAIRAESGPGR